jgi:hypothetical protein
MATQNQKDQLRKKLVKYSRKYLNEKNLELDESATRIMINNFLTEILGYAELEEVKTEYRIKDEYADYVVQTGRKKQFVVEVKAIHYDLSDNHLRQALNYAADEGIDWILLTNGRNFSLYKVVFAKPIDIKKVFSFNLADHKELKDSVEYLIFLTKKSVMKGELSDFWKRFQALEPTQLCKNLYSIEVVKFLKKFLKKHSDLSFSDDDVLDSLNVIIKTKIESERPKYPINVWGHKKDREALDNNRPAETANVESAKEEG